MSPFVFVEKICYTSTNFLSSDPHLIMSSEPGGALVNVFLLGTHRASRRGWSLLSMFAALLMLVAMIHLALIPAAWAQGKEEGMAESTGSQAGMGFAAGFLSLVYTPVKIVYAALGGIIGGFAYGLSGGDEKVAKKIWDTSLRGTYVLTPDHLRGDKPVRFLGVPQEDEETPALSSPPPSPPKPLPAN